jgi:hypothetical protein
LTAIAWRYRCEGTNGWRSRLLGRSVLVRRELGKEPHHRPQSKTEHHAGQRRGRSSSSPTTAMRNSKLRPQFERIIRRVGLKPWSKIFHNLRANRETELADQFPIKAARPLPWGTTCKCPMNTFSSR